MVRGSGRGERSRRLCARTALPSLLLLLTASLPGCDHGSASPWATGGAAGAGFGIGGAASSGTSAGTPGIALAGTMSAGPQPCSIPEVQTTVFGERIVFHEAPARRELFTWTTAEQAEELRSGGVLLTRIEREGLGPGFAMDSLKELSTRQGITPTEIDSIALAGVLSGPAFGKARYAWSEPWATRAGWPGESYGDQLVRIVLREDAWLAKFQSGLLDVVDMNNKLVPTKEALAHPERIAGIYFVRDADTGGPQCFGSFRGGSNGYREFIIGNEAMVEEWSLGTPEIRARLEADIELVQEFFNRIRPCPPTGLVNSWNLSVVCDWETVLRDTPVTELMAYQNALAIPSDNYLPTPVVLASLMDQLKASLFEPDPFVVKPDPLVLEPSEGGAFGGGGAPAEGGAGGAPPL